MQIKWNSPGELKLNPLTFVTEITAGSLSLDFRRLTINKAFSEEVEKFKEFVKGNGCCFFFFFKNKYKDLKDLKKNMKR